MTARQRMPFAETANGSAAQHTGLSGGYHLSHVGKRVEAKAGREVEWPNVRRRVTPPTPSASTYPTTNDSKQLDNARVREALCIRAVFDESASKGPSTRYGDTIRGTSTLLSGGATG
jgi:hypothetical protein